MRARAASKTGLSLTVAPRAQLRASPDKSDHRRARQVAWGALLVSAAAIGGYLLGPVLSGSSPSPRSKSVVLEGDGVHAPKSMVWIPGGDFLMGSEHQLASPMNARRIACRCTASGWTARTSPTRSSRSS